MLNIAVIFAGGFGTRMNIKSRPKQFLELNGKPIIIYTIELFDNHPDIDAIVVVCLESWIPFLRKQIKKFGISKVVKVVSGDESAHSSIYNGLCASEEYVDGCNADDAIVLIHDGVRPLITESVISENIAKVKECGNCITTIPAWETIVLDNHDNTYNILDRNDCIIARAPQSFYLRDIINAHRRCKEEGLEDFIDSCSLMNHYGHSIHTIKGSKENIKITTSTDFFVFKAIIEARESQQVFGL